jgi:Predicted transcriptional regulator
VDRSERFYRIDRVLRERRRTPQQRLIDECGVSRATIVRDIQYMRDRMHAPIAWDREQRGYHYAEGESFSLPGLWFSAEELEALLTLDHLLTTLQPGLLGKRLKPLRERLQTLVTKSMPRGVDLARRVRLLDSATARDAPPLFEYFAQATLERRRLRIQHHNRERDERSEREISPQRLVRYRDNWYCDAWCHHRNALRSFALDAVTDACVLDRRAAEIPDSKLDAKLGAGYGIFAGRKKLVAHLRFSAHAARWVSHERWHPQQRGRLLADGRYELHVPYTDERELLMDVMRHGAEVEVLGPPTLRQALRDRLRAALAAYEKASSTGSPPESLASIKSVP